MTITIGSFSTNALTAQPFAYEGEARQGLTARKIRVSGILTPSQWTALLAVYNNWRDTRITDPDTFSSGAVGTTVDVSVSSANGIIVASLPCWFTDAPSGEQVGAYVNTTVNLVDAAQALEVVLRTKQKSRQETEAAIPSFGTISLGNAVVTLIKPMETRQEGPNVALSASGTSYITGPLVAHNIRQIDGFITTGTFNDILSWYDTTIASVPSATSWFPITAPAATAEVIVSAGVKYTRYAVQLTVLQIL